MVLVLAAEEQSDWSVKVEVGRGKQNYDGEVVFSLSSLHLTSTFLLL